MLVTPLRKRRVKNADHALYQRRPDVEAEIERLLELPLKEAVTVCEQSGGNKATSSEAVLHLWRHMRGGDTGLRRRLFHLVVGRATRNLPNDDRSMSVVELRESSMDRFVDLLVEDEDSYNERLDYFEVNFNAAFLSIKRDVREAIRKRENRTERLEAEEGEDFAAKVEAVVESDDPLNAEKIDDRRYRSLLDAAIDKLPPLQARIIEMLRQEFQIDSIDPSVVTIRGALGKSDKTIRTHRDLAYARLRVLLTQGDSHAR